LLTDDGGLGLQHHAAWIDQAIVMTAEILSGTGGTSNWDCEAWGAELSMEKVFVFSLYVESCATTITLPTFQRVMAEWRRFIGRVPSKDEVLMIAV